jgi:hypothetical protein
MLTGNDCLFLLKMVNTGTGYFVQKLTFFVGSRALFRAKQKRTTGTPLYQYIIIKKSIPVPDFV